MFFSLILFELTFQRTLRAGRYVVQKCEDRVEPDDTPFWTLCSLARRCRQMVCGMSRFTRAKANARQTCGLSWMTCGPKGSPACGLN